MLLSGNYRYVSKEFGFETIAVRKVFKNKPEKRKKAPQKCRGHVCAGARAFLFLMLSDFTRVANVTAAKCAPLINPTAIWRQANKQPIM